MRRLGFISLAVILVAAAGYLASPFVAAWTLRNAIRAGDTKTIEQKIVWHSLRESLRVSIAKHQQLLPEATEMGAQVQPTVWQRVRSAFGTSMLDRFIETYVTPEGLPHLFRYKKIWTVSVKGEVDEEKLDFADRVGRLYRRVVRAEFQSPTRVEIEVMDKNTPDRRYVSVMELHGFEWKLASLQVTGSSGEQKPATALALP